MKILIFGGTAEARVLADKLDEMGHEVISSLAGRTTEPLIPQGTVRRGGFGGADLLRDYIVSEAIELVIDDTHPYSTQMSGRIAEVMANSEIPFLRLNRPLWKQPEGAEWVEKASITEAIETLPEGAIALVTTGHKELDAINARTDCTFYVRLMEKSDWTPGDNAKIIFERPPYALHSELSLLREFKITHMVTKNAGGDQTLPKIEAAAEMGVTAFMVRRPQLPAVAHEVTSVEAALNWIQERTS